MQTVSTLRALLVHGDWANDKLLAMAAPLADEALDRPFEIGAGSLRGTLAHLCFGERWWLDRWLGRPLDEGPTGKDAVTVASCRDGFEEAARERNAFLDDLGEAGESQRITFSFRDGAERSMPLGDLVLHVCNHAVHHRAQTLHMLRHVGAEVENVDYLCMKLAPDAEEQPGIAYDRDTIAEYFRYGDWAHGRVRDAVRGLDREALERPFEFGVGSLLQTLLHLADSDRWWLDNWSGKPADVFTALPETTTTDELDGVAEEVTARRTDLLASLGPQDLAEVITARPAPEVELRFKKGDTMLQVCTHGTHHRAQILNMLRHLDLEPPRVDYILWASEACA